VAAETFKLVVRPLLKCLADPVEKCRELSATIIEKYCLFVDGYQVD
jgi:hypothetical protein